jgi:hypothetical protein
MAMVVVHLSIHALHNYPHDHNVFYPSKDRILDIPLENGGSGDDDIDMQYPYICDWEK